ncbi:S8 family serine peptidase, partial [Pseudomonadales bacterium]|nr:S8 family serine peptidase [Pseudomonadales bacterium]
SVLDTADAFPLDKTETLDYDADGIGNNADTDDDNDGTADAEDAEPFDAFPWDTTLSIAQQIDQKTFPVNFFDASGTNDIQGLYSESEVGVYFDISQSGIARSFGNATTIGASEQTGTWSFTNNQLKLSGMRFSENPTFPSVSINDSQYTNIDWDKWAASSNGAQLSLVVEKDRSYWVISSANGRYEVYEKTIEKYYAASDVDYAIDPAKPVQTLDPVYKKRLFASVDEVPPLTWSEGELVDSAGITWALPLETKRQNGVDRKEGFEMISQDLATFSSDNTGQSRYGNRAFKWRIEQDGLTIEYQDKTVLRLYKYLEQPGFLGIRVLAFVQGDTGASEIYHAYKYGIKQEVDSLDMTQFFGRGLISEYSWSPVVPLSEKYSQALMLEFKDTGKVDARSGMPPSSGPRVWNLPYRTYSWKASGTKISADWCRNSAGNNGYADAPSGAEQDGVLDYCDYYLQSRLFEVLSVQERGAWISMNVRSFVSGGTFLADALAIESADTLSVGNVYTAFWSFQDNVADMDADGVLNGSDNYPFISLDGLADLDKDGIPDDCDSACIAKGMIADDDDDGDGIVDSTDAFPRDATETADTDVDGIGNNADTDDDNDGVLDPTDAFPLISLGGLTDQDGDGRPDECDVSCQTTGMSADLDDDGDGFVDTLESKLGAKMTDATSVLAYRVRGSAIEGASANARAGIVSLDGKGDRLAIGHGDETIAAGIFDWDDASSAWVKIQDSSITIKGSIVSMSGDGKTVVASPSISDIAPLKGLDIARSAVSDDGSESWALNSISSGYSMDGSTATFAAASVRITPIDNVALSQTNRLVYGMPYANANGRASVGSIALFELDGDNPSTLENEDEWNLVQGPIVGIDVGSGFGDHVAISSDGNTIAASGRFANNLSYSDGCGTVFLPKNGCPAPVPTTVSESFDPATRAGAVAVWRNWKGVYFNLGQVITGALGSQLSYIDLSDDGSILSVASPKSDENGTDSGSIRVYSYDETGRVWRQLGNTINDVPVTVGEFGRHALSGDGQVLVVTNSGGYGGAGLEQAGSVDAYRLVNGTWTRIGKRLSGGQRQSYAWSVDLNEDGSVLAVGARYYDGVAGADTGRVQVYELFATTDSDKDGIPDSDDAFKDDPTEYLDTDSDGIGNNTDTDDDEDGTPDSTDAFPLDKSETTDTDSDGFGNLYDSDDDGDGVADTADAFALISLGTLTDTDGDGRPNDCDATCQSTGMAADTDDDADGVLDTADGFPLISLGTLTDTDGDGRPNDCDATCQSTGMTADTDDDGDGTADSSDAYPLEACCWVPPSPMDTSATVKLLPQATNTISGYIRAHVQDGRVATFSLEPTMPPQLGTVTMNAAGDWSYQTNATTSDSDIFTFYVSDGVKTSGMMVFTITLSTDPLYKYQWHLDNTGQTNFATTAGTSGKDINVDAAIVAGKTGAGVKVAVVDSGLELAHEDLAANVISGSRDFVNSDDDPTPSSSAGDHGTSVAGIIGAVGWNNIGVRGVAPGASLKGYNYLVPSAQGVTNWISTFGGETYSSDIDIFNFSAGTYNRAFSLASSTHQTTFISTLPSLRSGKGAILVKSAGNSFSEDANAYSGSAVCGHSAGLGLSCHDANLDNHHFWPQVIVVGALAADGKKSSYSSVGSPLWVSAPGGEYGVNTSYISTSGVGLEPAIMTTDLSSCSSGYGSAAQTSSSEGTKVYNAFNDFGSPYSENSNCNYVSTFNGTSSAAPNVSGVIALMLEANPSLTWRDVKHILATTANQVDSDISPISVDGIAYHYWVENDAKYKFHPYYGFGGVDATAAVNAAVSYTAGSLGTQTYKDWTLSGTLNSTVSEGVTATSVINISSSGTLEFVRVRVNMSHSLPYEIGMRLVSPSGTETTILQPYTALNVNPNGYIYLAASAFYGESMNGNWTLKLFDHNTNSTQMTLGDWSIAFYHR